MVDFVNYVRSFLNYAIFGELCDQMRSEVNCAKSHHRVISEGLHMKNKSVKLPFVTKNSKHLMGTSGDDLPALIEFTPLWKTSVKYLVIFPCNNKTIVTCTYCKRSNSFKSK